MLLKTQNIFIHFLIRGVTFRILIFIVEFCRWNFSIKFFTVTLSFLFIYESHINPYAIVFLPIYMFCNICSIPENWVDFCSPEWMTMMEKAVVNEGWIMMCISLNNNCAQCSLVGSWCTLVVISLVFYSLIYCTKMIWHILQSGILENLIYSIISWFDFEYCSRLFAFPSYIQLFILFRINISEKSLPVLLSKSNIVIVMNIWKERKLRTILLENNFKVIRFNT